MNLHGAQHHFVDAHELSHGGGLEPDDTPSWPWQEPPLTLAVPMLPRVPWATLRAGDARREQVRALRAELLIQREAQRDMQREGGERADVLALVSPCAGEGRTTLAAELARSFAQAGHLTLLVDADLRAPHQHHLFDLANRHGLAQAISQDTPVLPQPVAGVARLQVLVAGEPEVDPLALLSSRRLGTLLQGWRSTYDVVLFDTPSLSRHADALAVASQTRRVLTLSRAQHTPRDAVDALLRRLAPTRATLVGGVLSHF